MKDLENKIREALPRLKELTKGCLITVREYPNEIIELSNNEYPHKVNAISLEGKYIIIDFEDAWGSNNTATYKETIGHPIKLNDVLEYFTSDSNILYETYIDRINYIVENWDLSSVFLADQSDELKEFLNGL